MKTVYFAGVSDFGRVTLTRLKVEEKPKTYTITGKQDLIGHFFGVRLDKDAPYVFDDPTGAIQYIIDQSNRAIDEKRRDIASLEANVTLLGDLSIMLKEGDDDENS